jgi:hypothetical protein
MERREQPTAAGADAESPSPQRSADPDREARRLNRQASAALRKLRLAVEEEPSLVFRP